MVSPSIPARVTHTVHGEILEWNEGAERLYGWSADEAIGANFFEIVPTSFPNRYSELLVELGEKGILPLLLIQRSKSAADLFNQGQWALDEAQLTFTTDSNPRLDTFLGNPLTGCLLDTYPGTAFLLDLRDQRMVFIKGRPLGELGYTHQELREMGSEVLPRLIHPEDLGRIAEQIEGLSAAGSAQVLETCHRARPKGGGWRHLMTSISVFAWDYSGEPTHLAGFASDVTEQREAEQGLRIAQEQLKFALSATGMVAWIWDYATDEVLRIGDVKSIYGNIESNSDAFLKAVHPDDWHLSDEAIDRARVGNQMGGVQMRIIRADGHLRWIEERGTVQYNSRGEPSHMVGVTIDVTEQRSKDEISRRTHRSLRLALQAARASTWQWDVLTNLIVVSDDAFELFGLPRGAPPTMDDWLERIHPDDRHDFWMEARRTASEGMDLFIDFRLAMPDGSIKPVRAVAQRAPDRSGNETEVIGVVMDLSIFRGIADGEDPGEPQRLAS